MEAVGYGAALQGDLPRAVAAFRAKHEADPFFGWGGGRDLRPSSPPRRLRAAASARPGVKYNGREDLRRAIRQMEEVIDNYIWSTCLEFVRQICMRMALAVQDPRARWYADNNSDSLKGMAGSFYPFLA